MALFCAAIRRDSVSLLRFPTIIIIAKTTQNLTLFLLPAYKYYNT